MKNRKKNPKFCPKKKIWRRKIEICKSSETRVAEVSWRSERSSRGKRTFAVRRRLGGIREAYTILESSTNQVFFWRILIWSFEDSSPM